MTGDERTDDQVADHVRLIIAGMTAWLHDDGDTVYRVCEELNSSEQMTLSLLEMCFLSNKRLAELVHRDPAEHFQRLGLATFIASDIDRSEDWE